MQQVKSALYENSNEFCLNLGAEWIKKIRINRIISDLRKNKDMGDTGYIMYGNGEKFVVSVTNSE